ncbi:MAG TPA: LPS assembly protein LptD [Nevskiaceae bacterium]|nr:LPS assembly protein LptD [Nevskiaceae bacterium]
MRHTLNHALRCCALLALPLALAVPAVAAAATPAATCVQPDYAAGLTPASHDDRIVITADQADASLGSSGLSTLSGAVQVSQRGRVFATQNARYDAETRKLRINGVSRFRGPSFQIESQGARFDLNTESGLFTDSKFALPRAHGHGAADKLQLTRSGTAQLDRASYTTCTTKNPAWVLSASKLHLDQQDGIGTARNVTLRLGGVPVIWLPWFRFPTDGRRRTGFLYPTVAQSTKTGFDLRTPFYFNLAPNYDDVFTPRFMSNRGVLLADKFRYLLPHDQGSLEYQYLNHDRVVGHERSFIDLQQQGLLASDLGLDVNFQQASDLNYFDDFGGTYAGSSLADSATPFLPRSATLTFHRGNSPTTVQLLAESYQPLTVLPSPNDRPYKRLPELRVQTLTRQSLFNVHAGLDGNFNSFERDGAGTTGPSHGQRVYLDPYLDWNDDHTGWYLASRLDGTWTQYHVAATTPGAPSNPSRTLPIFSANGGLRFNRVTQSGMLQTLEPHLGYLFVPYDNQSDLPVFDTGQPDFDFPELFARNRFTGIDRISDANHLTGVMTTRLIDPTSGLVRLSASAGVIYRFSAPRITLPGVPNPSAGTSDYVGSLEYRVNRFWSTSSQIQWDPVGDHVVRAAERLSYETNSEQRVTGGYEYREGLFNQADIGFVLPIEDRWHVAGRVIYSIRDASSLGAFAGVEYETCCWAIRAGARRYVSDVQGTFTTTAFLQFTLKGLASIGNGWGGLLPVDEQNIRGVVHR